MSEKVMVNWDLAEYVEDLQVMILMYLKAHYPTEFVEGGEVPEHMEPLLTDHDVLEMVLKWMLKVMWVGQTIKHTGGGMLQRLTGMVKLCLNGEDESNEAVYAHAVFTAEVCEKMLNIVPTNVNQLKFVALKAKQLFAEGDYHDT